MSFGEVLNVMAAMDNVNTLQLPQFPVIRGHTIANVKPFLEETTARLSAGLLSKGEIPLHNAGFISAMKNKYGGDSIGDSISNMLYFAQEARQGILYDQVAKFVGRVEINGVYTGTGTLVNWDGMQENLVGRVVLTVAHNHPSWSDVANSDHQKYMSLYADPVETISGTSSSIYVSDHTKSNDPLDKHMWFTPDTDIDRFNVWGSGTNDNSIPVQKWYTWLTMMVRSIWHHLEK
jgi:hypothetical protein